MNMILSKRQIVLTALILALCIAIYLNWQYSSEGEGLILTGLLGEGKNYGDAQFVDNADDEGEAYFAESKLSRTQSRDEAVQTLKDILASANITDEQKADLALKAVELAKSIEVEGKIENLIKAKGFSDCMVYYDTQRVDAIVKTNGLSDQEAIQIKDIIVEQAGIEPENISIIEVK